MGSARGLLPPLAAALGGALLAGVTTAVLTLAGAFTPPPADAVGPDLDERPITWQERMAQARPYPSVGVMPEADQVRESTLARQRIKMLGHLYVVELVSSEYVAFPGVPVGPVHRAKEGGAFVDFRLESAGRDKEAASSALSSAAHGDPSVTFVVKSGGKTLRSDYRISVVGDPRGTRPTLRAVWPGPISVPKVEGAEYRIEVDGEPLDILP